MADWQAYNRAVRIEGLRKAIEIAQNIRATASSDHIQQQGQRRGCTRVIQAIEDEIVRIEEEGRAAVRAAFPTEADRQAWLEGNWADD